MTSARLGMWWWDGTHVADLEGEAGDVRLRYSDDVLAAHPANSPVVSCSLPLTRRALQAGPFLRGVLPEGQHLAAIAAHAGVATTDTLGLLRRFGRDIAGALVIAPTFPGPRSGTAEPYSPEALAQEVAGVDDGALGVHDDSELSIAGLQDKVLLIRTTDGWARPVGGAPSTHVLKVDDPRHPGLVAAEAAAMRLARSLQLTSVEVEELTVGGVACLAVSRFDRAVEHGEVRRIHQEDLCQATGREPSSKYERSGGPTLRQVAAVLDAHAADPLTELDRLVAVVTFSVLIGNADAHGKNVAVLHGDDHVTLAPLYDQVPTVLWPNLRRTPAMSIGPRVAGLRDIGRDDIVAEARHWQHHGERAARVVGATAEAARGHALACGHEGVQAVVERNAECLLRGGLDSGG